MALLTTWVRIELRRRWRSLLVLALLIAVASCTVLAATAGARRGESTMKRLLDRTLPQHGIVVPNLPGFDWDPVRALPGVEALGTFALNGPGDEGIPIEETSAGLPPPADDQSMHTIERPVVLEGRLADTTRADEVVVTAGFAQRNGYGVGDTVRLLLHEPETVDRMARTSTWGEVPYDGPKPEARIVGVVRSGWFNDEPASVGSLMTTPAFFEKYEANLLGRGPSVPVNALVRLTDGAAGLPEFRRQLAEVAGKPIDVWNSAEENARTQDTLTFLALSLLAFGLAALLAALFLVGQALARYTAASVADLLQLRSLGLTPRQAMLAAAAPPTMAGLTGSLLGIGGALVVSIWMPFGDAKLLEPAPGLSADWLVLGVGGVLVVVAVGAAVVGSAWLAMLASSSPRSARRSMLAAAATRFGLPVPVVIGTRFALEPGRDRGTVPVRPAILGAVTGVLGILAAFTFSAGAADASDSPARYGQTHELQTEVAMSPEQLEATIARWSADPDVVGVTNAPSDVAETETATFTVYDNDTRGEPLDIVILDGRMPQSVDEIAIAPMTAKELGAGLGAKLHLKGTRGGRTVTVTGIGFVPHGAHNDYSEGSWMIPAGYEALFDPETPKFHAVLFDLRSGAELGAVTDRLTTMAPKGVEVRIGPPSPPLQVVLIRGIRVLPVLLGGFLAVLALGAVGHAVATAVRRRRHEIAVLRALGMTRWQARGIVITQATVLAGIGLLLGIPLGLALGRTLWRVVADITPLEYVAPAAAFALLLVVPAALLVSNLLALWPGRVAAGMRVGQVLRAE